MKGTTPGDKFSYGSCRRIYGW